MQVLLFLLFVSSSVARPTGREVYYDFDYDYGADHNPHDYDGWPRPLVTTGRTIPSRSCFGVICRFERGDNTPSSSDTTPMSNSVEVIGKTTPGKCTIYVLFYNVVILGNPVTTKEDTRTQAPCVAPPGVSETPGSELKSGGSQLVQYPATAPFGRWGWQAIIALFLVGVCAGATKCFCTG